MLSRTRVLNASVLSLGLLAGRTEPALGQSDETGRGGFVVTLGRDTMQVERFTRTGRRIDGTVVTRSPHTRIARYTLELDEAGRVSRYTVSATRGDGTPERSVGLGGSFTRVADTLVRETPGQQKPDTQRVAAAGNVFPGPMVPYTGVSFLMYELALGDARRRANASGESAISLVTLIPRQVTPGNTRAWFIGADSAELDYFGVARSGWKFAPDGRLLRADWTATTYRYRITRADNVDVDDLSAAWARADAAGAGMGAMSPRDTARARVGSVEVMVDYSRPARRGREVWGAVVPWGQVWRLGADFATHLVVSGDVRLGDTAIPAGSYTIWMIPSSDGTAQLVVNKRTRIFGTMYDATQDLVRVPLTGSPSTELVERLTIDVADGRLRIRWGDRAWSAPIVASP